MPFHTPHPHAVPPPLRPRRNWQRHWVAQLTAVVIGVGPLYGLAIYTGYLSLLAGDFSVPAANEMLASLVATAFFIMLILGLLGVLGERFSDLQLQPGTLSGDVGQGVLLALALVVLMMALNAALNLMGVGAVPEANLRIGEALAADPLLLVVFIGPVVWLQAGVLEELSRVFALTRLWNVWPRARVAALVIWSALFGLAHMYQGAVGIVGTGLIGLLLGAHYLVRGRVLPLIIAHGLYDTLVIGLLVALAQNPEALEELRGPAALPLPGLPWL